MGRMKSGIVGIAVIVAALGAAELYLRLTVPAERVFELWYSRGIHRPDPKFGFAFRENYRGAMCMGDGVPWIPLQLDENGYRLPASSPAREGAAPADVVLVGGASMAFSYGLPDDQTLHAQVARHAHTNLRVRNAAWPGFGTHLCWHAYLDRLESRLATRAVLLLQYGDVPESIPEDPATLPVPPTREELFSTFDDLVVPPRGAIARALGLENNPSFLLAPFVRVCDRGWTRLGLTAPGPTIVRSEPPLPEKLTRWNRFVSHVERHLRARGASLLVVFLPRQGAPEDYYGTFRASLPPGVRQVDVHRELHDGFASLGWIAAGHFGPRQAAAIGRRLATEVDALLEADGK